MTVLYFSVLRENFISSSQNFSRYRAAGQCRPPARPPLRRRRPHVNVESAGTGLMAGVAHVDGFLQDGLPGHFVLMARQRHGMSDDLTTVIQTSIMFAVDVFVPAIDSIQDPAGIGVGLAGTVDLQFDTHVEGAVAVEDGLGTAVIVVDGVAAVMPDITVITQRVFIIAVGISGVALVDDAAAAGTGYVPVVIAGLAQGCVDVAGVVIMPDTVSAVSADDGAFPETFGTE